MSGEGYYKIFVHGEKSYFTLSSLSEFLRVSAGCNNKQPVFLITFVVIFGWHTPQDVPIPSIHNSIAAAMSICVAVGNKVMDSPVCLSL